MSSKDDPFGAGGKTVIAPNADRWRRPGATPVSKQPAPASKPDSTLFDPGFVQQPLPGWGPSATVFDPGGGARQDPRHNPTGSASPAQPDGKIPQEMFLEARGRVEYASDNPMIAAAGPLLALLGQLRRSATDIQPAPLAQHVADAIEAFDSRLAKAGVAEADARIAKYALCETADDVVANLPGFDAAQWLQLGMLPRFFNAQTPGTGFFEALNKALAKPEQHYDLLELMHACLSLGFEGQYRGAPRQDSGLERVRRDVYDTLRYFRPRAGEEISPHWQGSSLAMAKTRRQLPLWAVAAAMCAVLTAAFFMLRSLITDQGDALASELLALNPSAPVVIERASLAPLAAEPPVEEAAAPVAQASGRIDRVRAALVKEIESGGLTVDKKGEFIVVEINNLVLFQPGQAELKAEFKAMAGRLAAALEPEPGPIRIVGHTDNVKPRKSGVFKSNYDLSVARAKAVEVSIAPKLSDPSRIVIEGKGEDEPIADNATQEGRAKNRRVDLLIPQEGTP